MDWTPLQQRVDRAVDDQWGEDVILIPWNSAEYSGLGGPDINRDVLATRGIIDTPGDATVSQSEGFGGPASARLLAQEIWLSITEGNLGDDWTLWKQYDRVWCIDRNQMFQVNYTAPSVTSRPKIHLIREQANGLIAGQGNPTGVITPLATNQIYFDVRSYRSYRAASRVNTSWARL